MQPHVVSDFEGLLLCDLRLAVEERGLERGLEGAHAALGAIEARLPLLGVDVCAAAGAGLR